MILEWLVAEVVPVGVVSACCFFSTFAAGLVVSLARWRRPDLRMIGAYATLSPLTIPVLGGRAIAFTLLPTAPLFLVAALVVPNDLGAIAQWYVILGTYVCGWGIQVSWLWDG